MLKVNKLTDYSLVILSQLGQHKGYMANAMQLSEATGINSPTVSKILKILQPRGLVISHRGANGGYELAKTIDAISVAEVIQAMEGPMAVTQCNIGPGHCEQESSCQMRAPWHKINQVIIDLLSNISLADMLQPEKGKF